MNAPLAHRLDPATRRAIYLASTLGAVFWAALLAWLTNTAVPAYLNSI